MSGVFAEKQGVWRKKTIISQAFSRFFALYSFAMLYPQATSVLRHPSKKIIPENPL
jgi:hypothetical protein